MRPLLLAMCNPHSDDPRHALYPVPENSAGGRLWQMAHEATGISKTEWIRSTDRINVCPDRVWDPSRVDRPAVFEMCVGRSVLVVGRPVAQVLWLQQTEPLLWQHDEFRWCYLPHPSGLNHWYNDELHRLAVGYRLEELLHQPGGGCEEPAGRV